MAREIFGLILNEGYTDLGTFEVEITGVEHGTDKSVVLANPQSGNTSRSLLFRLLFNDGANTPVSPDYKAVFTHNPVSGLTYEYTAHTNAEGYLQIDTAVVPVAVISTGLTIYMQVNGAITKRRDENYLRVVGPSSAVLYTMITNFTVDAEYLCVRKDDTTHYRINIGTSTTPAYISIPGGTEAILITTGGVVYTCASGGNTWTSRGTLKFCQFANPALLTVNSDGFYNIGTSGAPDEGTLGTGPFEFYSLSMQNPDVFRVNLNMTVYNAGNTQVGLTHTFTGLVPGTLNVTIKDTIAAPSAAGDDSPRITDVADLTPGFSFSSTFSAFLNGLTTNPPVSLNTLRKKGPLQYITGFPAGLLDTHGEPVAEVKLLQSHIDLYAFNPDIAQNKWLINAGYDGVHKIAITPQDVFVKALDNASIGFNTVTAAQLYQTIYHGHQLFTTVLAGTLSDVATQSGSSAGASGSGFKGALEKASNSCGCNDCQSSISPFAYLMDLLRYGATHVKKTTSFLDYKAFAIDLETTFIQKFGKYKVDCETLHEEFCRVRLVTEVLEDVVAKLPSNSPALPILAKEREKFLWLVYTNILAQAGTSVEEIRDIKAIQNTAEKIEAARKISDRLGLPLYDPTTPSALTATQLWLSPTDTSYPLTATTLQNLFGFRSTTLNILSPTPASSYSNWQNVSLANAWKAADYPATAYSREAINMSSPGSTIFSNSWKPIIDPDIIGWDDMTYTPNSVAASLYTHRKTFIDNFLLFCSGFSTGSTVTSRTSIDIAGRVLRVTDRDLLSHVFENNTVWLENPGTSTWDPFVVSSKNLNQTDTDIYLLKETPAVSQPTAFQPNGTSPNMRYRKVLAITNLSAVSQSVQFTVNFTDPLITDKLTGGYVKIQSLNSATSVTTTYDTLGGTPSLTVGTVTSNSIQLTINVAPVSNFHTGTVSLIYEAQVPLKTTVLLDSSKLVNDLFTTSRTYTMLSPAAFTPSAYTIWVVSNWQGVAGSTNYERLKNLHMLLSQGVATKLQIKIVTDNLRLSTDQFNKMMELSLLCEAFHQSMYTASQPTVAELYELASIIHNCTKPLLQETWVKEEVLHIPSGGSAARLMLKLSHFWKSVSEPVTGSWDPSLQTTTSSAVPLIDPELLDRKLLLDSPQAKPYLVLYDARKDTLDRQLKGFHDPSTWGAFGVDIFNRILNYVNSGNNATSYVSALSPYTSLQSLLDELNSAVNYKRLKAIEKVWSVFRLTEVDFLAVMATKSAFESNIPAKQPSFNEKDKAFRLLVSAFKRKQLYLGYLSVTSWITEEVNGFNFPGQSAPMLPLPAVTVPAVKYYNVLKMRMAPGRGNREERAEWQRTLELWNRRPFIHPDYVPAENIKNFISTNWVYTTWTGIKSALDSHVANLKAALSFNATNPSASTVLTALNQQLNLVVARTKNIVSGTAFVPLANLDHLPYFTNLKTMEANGEDIRPCLKQLCMNISEYRVLAKVYSTLESAALASANSPLMDEEKDDVVNILMHIHSHFERYDQVWQELKPSTAGVQTLVFNGEKFQSYKPSPVNFPANTIQVPNKWRSPAAYRREWRDLLETRIEREQATKEKWKNILEEAEDRNMPFMRDALIRALTGSCESHEDAAERLAKTYFIETKDNCCVKHTRISFAIETIQGFYYALSSGIYDSTISAYKLYAPLFNLEWRWLGSYASWRAAVFVFIYPENLLHPALRRRQSPAFAEISYNLSNASRFSPQDACDAAKRYQDYLKDIADIEMVCTTSALASVYKENATDCCGEAYDNKFFTFYFGQNPNSGNAYYCRKEFNDKTAQALGFWEQIPIPHANTKVLGCYFLGNFRSKDDSLWLFYSYNDKGKFKMGFLKKYLGDPGSIWIPGDVCDLPQYLGKNPVAVIATQCDSTLAEPRFIFSFTASTISKYVSVYYWYNHDANYFFTNNLLTSHYGKLPITAVSHRNGGVVIAYEDNIKFYWSSDMNAGAFYSTHFSVTIQKVIGVFEDKRAANNTFVIVYEDSSSSLCIDNLSFFNNGTSISGPTQNPITISGSSLVFQNIKKIYPFFVQGGYPGFYAVKTKSDLLLGCYLYTTATPNVFLSEPYRLTPLAPVNVPIESADCTADVGIRRAGIKQNMETNVSIPTGISNYTRMEAHNTYLWEAYYFVPMLLALDQQKRGQYPSALAWYRSVYDYTIDANASRKIFLGLKLEQTITNSYSYYSNWLSDPLDPHRIAPTRKNAYSKYTLMNIIQCLYAYADREFTLDTIESVPRARKMYSAALDLMRVNELMLNSNECLTSAVDCLNGLQHMNNAKVLPALYQQLQDKLAELGDKATIQSVSATINGYFNGATESNAADKFALAFDAVNSALSAQVHTSSDVETILDGTAKHIDLAYSYLFAETNLQHFQDYVTENFTYNIAEISGVAPENATSSGEQGSFAWLREPLPDNSVEYSFAFTDGNGVQFFEGEKRFNPDSPTGIAFGANVTYANAGQVTGGTGGTFVPTFTPLINYNQFCIPTNPVYKSLELKGNLELFKIFNCRNIAGMVRELSVYGAATDSTTGVPIIGASGNLVLPGLNAFAPSQYRFKVLIERAKQLCEQAKQMESMFLASLEKQDAETYSQILAKQGIESANATVKLQDLRINQANSERTLADLNLDKVNFMQQHFSKLIDEGLIGFEQDGLNALGRSVHWLENAMIAQIVAGIAYVGQGVSYGVAAKISKDADKANAIAGVFGAAAAVSNSIASAYSTQSSIDSIKSSIALQLAGYERRTQEWEYQKNLSGKDIQIASQQIKIADDNIRIVGQEREIAQLSVEHAKDSYEFMRNKFTNAALYSWMSNVLERSYSFMLNLSTAVAKAAEGQLYFERQEQAGPFILGDYWETPTGGSVSVANGGNADRRGLTGSARLMVDITRLEQHAFETNKRKLQLTKVISLANNFPSEFQNFKQTGVMNFELTNKLFDYDFPGHYLRLINSVKTTVVGLVPVYDGIKATLTAGSISYTVIGGNTFQKTPIKRMELDSVALTSATNATGLFEMQPAQGELLNPFEGMGVESRWEFKLPQFSNRMDLSTIADVLITLEYTALDSFQYRYQVLQELDNNISFNRGFSFKNEFPDQWFELGEALSGSPTFGVTFELKREHYPIGIENLKMNGDLVMYFVREDGYTEEIDGVEVRVASNNGAFAPAKTNAGKINTNAVSLAMSGNPTSKLKLLFTNNIINRDLFANGQVRDILILVKCKAELKAYPL